MPDRGPLNLCRLERSAAECFEQLRLVSTFKLCRLEIAPGAEELRHLRELLPFRTGIRSLRRTSDFPPMAWSRQRARSDHEPQFHSSTRCKLGAVERLGKLFREWELGGSLIDTRVAIRTGFLRGDVAGAYHDLPAKTGRLCGNFRGKGLWY